MKLRHRPMQPEDIPECVDIVANHPVVGPRYGATIKLLPEAWRRMLQCEAQIAVVVQAEEGLGAPVCFSGIGLIVRDDFLLEMKKSPHFWIGPELARRIVSGESPILTGEELREGNSRGGLNLVCWESCVRSEYEANGEVQRYMVSGFIETSRGYLWKEVISSQSWNPEHLDFILTTGGYFWDARAGGYTSTLTKTSREIVSEPHILGITRDLELRRTAHWGTSWVGALFDYHPPVLGLSRNEQRLLLCALRGETDEQVAELLELSLSAVKKKWVSIYRRVETRLPELLPNSSESGLSASGRGKEKRRRLLAYLREHLEELRPNSRIHQGC